MELAERIISPRITLTVKKNFAQCPLCERTFTKKTGKITEYLQKYKDLIEAKNGMCAPCMGKIIRKDASVEEIESLMRVFSEHKKALARKLYYDKESELWRMWRG